MGLWTKDEGPIAVVVVWSFPADVRETCARSIGKEGSLTARALTASSLAAGLCLFLAACTTPMAAFPPPIKPRPVAVPAAVPRKIATRVVEGAPTLAPLAHVEFCKQNPDDCRAGEADAIVPMTAGARAELEAVNTEINTSIVPFGDASGGIGDVWSLSPALGDCEDYAVTKRHRLIEMGWPVSALRLITAQTGAGEDHAALLVRTSDGDLVLDNRIPIIRPIERTDLSLRKIQSGSDPHRWFSAPSTRGPLVSSLD